MKYADLHCTVPDRRSLLSKSENNGKSMLRFCDLASLRDPPKDSRKIAKDVRISLGSTISLSRIRFKNDHSHRQWRRIAGAKTIEYRETRFEKLWIAKQSRGSLRLSFVFSSEPGSIWTSRLFGSLHWIESMRETPSSEFANPLRQR